MAEENKYNILIESGADFVLPFTWYDNNGSPYDLTGATVEAQLREFPEAVDALDFVCSHNGTGGRITISMPHESTAQIPFSYGAYDVFVNLPEGGRKRPLHGEVTVQDYVTKPIDGTMLLIIGVNSFEDLPAVGNVNRFYYDYENRMFWRWNGTNYVSVFSGGVEDIYLKEHVDDFTDIYTIVYDDGKTFDFTVFVKGIASIDKISSSGDDKEGIVDTYRITFSDDSTYDYEIKNGRCDFDVLFEYVSAAEKLVITYDDTSQEAYKKTDLTDIAPTFSENENYEAGDYVNHNGKIYRFTAEHVGAWDDEHAEEVIITSDYLPKTDLTFDDTPTAGSSNPVTSDGIKTAIDAKADSVIDSVSGAIVFFPDGTGIPTPTSVTVAIEGTQSGSGTPSPDNVRPLTGFDSATLWHTGKNLLHCTGLKSNKGITASENADGSITVAGTPTSTYADIMTTKSQVLKAGTYTFSISKTLACHATIRLAYSSAAGDYVSLGISAGQTSATVTAARDVHSWRLYVSGMTAGTAINETFYMQVEAGSEPTAYEPCTESVMPFTFDASPTVYSGTLDVLTGVLTVNQVLRTFTEVIRLEESTYVARIAEDGKSWSTKVRYSYLKTVGNVLPAEGEGSVPSTLGRLLICLPGVTTEEECNAYLAENPLQVAYELGTPLTYQLTPVEVITILSGQNYFWSDAGDVTVRYRVDTKEYIDQRLNAVKALMTNVEQTMTLTANRSTGDVVIVGDAFYKLTANVASGSSLVVGTNCVQTTMADWILSLTE